jgi:hypothetical protein
MIKTWPIRRQRSSFIIIIARSVSPQSALRNAKTPRTLSAPRADESGDPGRNIESASCHPESSHCASTLTLEILIWEIDPSEATHLSTKAQYVF